MDTERAQVGWRFWLWWVLANTVGFAVGWVVGFALGRIWAMGGFVHFAMGLVMGVAVGAASIGASIGTAQWLVLRRQVSGAGWWVLASIAGSAGGAAVLFLIDGIIIDVPLSVVFFVQLFGYQAITGAVLVWLLRQPRHNGTKSSARGL